MPELYAPNFRFQEFAMSRNAFLGVVADAGLGAIDIGLSIRPIRWLAQKFAAYAPGDGPPEKSLAESQTALQGVATADQQGKGAENKPGKASGKLTYKGGPYDMSGLLPAEAAMILLDQKYIPVAGKGGIVTPAFLGQAYIDRLQKAGVKIETTIMRD
jgi:short subunit dehydrogenase-like uncharacterized protein